MQAYILDRSVGGGPQIVTTHTQFDSVTVDLTCGVVTSWRPNGEEQLYSSSIHPNAGVKARRGGIPICFPQFGPLGPLMKHGFFREIDEKLWKRSEEGVDSFQKSFLAQDTKFHCNLHADLHIDISSPGILAIKLTVTGDDDFEWTGAFHPYFKTSEIKQTQVRGLEGCLAIDKTRGANDKFNETVTGPIEFSDASKPCDTMFKSEKGRVIELIRPSPDRKMRISGGDEFPDFVVWNVGSPEVSELNDMPNEDQGKYLCVETAKIDRSLVKKDTPLMLTMKLEMLSEDLND